MFRPYRTSCRASTQSGTRGAPHLAAVSALRRISLLGCVFGGVFGAAAGNAWATAAETASDPNPPGGQEHPATARPAGAPDADEVVDADRAPPVTPPEVVSRVDAVLPPTASAPGGQSGSVVLLVTVNVDGTVSDVAVAQSAGDAFDAAAVAAVRQWRFQPARRGPVAVASRIRVPFSFAQPQSTSAAVATSATPAAPPLLPPPPTTPASATLPPPHATPSDSGAPPTASPDTPDPDGVVEVTVRGRRTPPPRATSDFTVERVVLSAAPHASAGDLLATAPGVFVTRPEGEAVAHQIFLRGFDAEHGQDMEINVGPVPVNQPSHIHGQGYADLNFVIPEAVRSLRVTEGVYDPRQGDFAVAGSVDFDLGVPERGYRLKSSWGSFQTFRQSAVFAPPGEAEETFGAVVFQRSRGYGQNRGSQSAAAIGQLALHGPGGWTLLLHMAAHGARANLAGVLRADDVAAGAVGFYDSYPDPSANEQSALGSRAQLAVTMERAGDDGTRTQLAAYVIASTFRLRENFTGYTQRSREQPEWIGRGDLIEQANQAVSLGGRLEHRTRRFSPAAFADGFLALGLSFRADSTDQTQNLLKAPQNETWDHRIDATIHGADVGAFFDADVRLGSRVKLRGGYRADALTYDVDDRLGNFAPLFQRQTHFLGFRRTAQGIAAGPRVTAEVTAARWLTAMVSYGEGYRSPQPTQLEEGENAPFAKVRSAELGARLRLAADRLNLTFAAFETRLSQDLAFNPDEGSLTKVGPTTRRGVVAHALARPWPFALASVSVTSVRATLDAPAPPTAAQPTPPYRAGELLPYVPPLVFRADLSVVGHWFKNGASGNVAAPGSGVVGGVDGRCGIGFNFIGSRPLPYGQFADPVSLLDASAALGWRAFELGVEASNLLGRTYAANEYSFVSNWGRQEIPSLVPARHVSAGPPRSVLGTLTVRF